MDHVVCLAQVVNPQEAMGNCVYAWSELGQAVYSDWWTQRFRSHYKDLGAGRDAIRRIADSDWFDWSAGSRPLHWNWPSWYMEIARDGLPVWWHEAPKQWRRPQEAPKNKSERDAIAKKIEKVRDRGYVCAGEVHSLTSFFAVPKGIDDIRVVFDGTKSGLNACIWVPRFPLPTVNSLLRASLAGLDLTEFFGDGKILWERWVRAAFGLRSSPYQAFQAVLVAKEYMLGDRKDSQNVFRWDKVVLNLPGSKHYDPSKPWVSKIRVDDGKVACDLFVYIDDGRVTGNNVTETDEATRVATSRLQKLGIQDAPRKRRWATKRPGAWAGSIVETRGDSVYVTVSDEKWEKSQKYIGEMLSELKIG